MISINMDRCHRKILVLNFTKSSDKLDINFKNKTTRIHDTDGAIEINPIYSVFVFKYIISFLSRDIDIL